KIVSAALEDVDYVALAQDERTADTAVQVFMVRHGRLVGRDSFLLEGAEVFNLQANNGDSADADPAGTSQLGALIGAFIQQFYDNVAFIPSLVLVQAMPPDQAVLEEWLA
ncbi:MAG: hypothetical protein KDE24_09755, partial [Caldilinea sp.]|nr:hypothetical protein [Caldilinea sp.]